MNPHHTPEKYKESFIHCKWYAEPRRNVKLFIDDRDYTVGDDETFPESFPLCEIGASSKVSCVSKKETSKRKKKKIVSEKKKKPKKKKKKISNSKVRERELMKFCKKAYGIGRCDHYLKRREDDHRWDRVGSKKKHDIVFIDDEKHNLRTKKRLVSDRISIHDRGESEYIRSSVVNTRMMVENRLKLKMHKIRLEKKRNENRGMFELGIHDSSYGLWNAGLANEELNKRRRELMRRGNLDLFNEETNPYDLYLESKKKNPYVDYIRN